MSIEADLFGAFETHSPDGIRESLAAGISPTEPINGLRPIDSLIAMYLRSPRFTECLKIMLDAGATIDDPLLKAVLLDDDAALRGTVGQIKSKRHEETEYPVRFHILPGRLGFAHLRGVQLRALCARPFGERC